MSQMFSHIHLRPCYPCPSLPFDEQFDTEDEEIIRIIHFGDGGAPASGRHWETLGDTGRQFRSSFVPWEGGGVDEGAAAACATAFTTSDGAGLQQRPAHGLNLPSRSIEAELHPDKRASPTSHSSHAGAMRRQRMRHVASTELVTGRRRHGMACAAETS